jgi:hypothetical protein
MNCKFVPPSTATPQWGTTQTPLNLQFIPQSTSTSDSYRLGLRSADTHLAMSALPEIPPVIRVILQDRRLRHALFHYECRCESQHVNLCRNEGTAVAFCRGSNKCPTPDCQVDCKEAWKLRRHFPGCFKQHFHHEITVLPDSEWTPEHDTAWFRYWSAIFVSGGGALLL